MNKDFGRDAPNTSPAEVFDGPAATSPGVTVVVAAYNAADTISAAVESMLAQETQWESEVVVVDDGSTDDTASIVRSLRQYDQRVSLISLGENVGRAAARNIGIAAGRFDFVAVQDADDVALPGRLEAHRRAFEANPGADIVAGQLLDFSESGEMRPSELSFPTTEQEIAAWLARGRMPMAHPASAFRRAWFDAIGGYDSRLRWCEDFDLVLRGWRAHALVSTVQPLTGYRRRTTVTDWSYWWQSDRHRAAVVRRWRQAASPRPKSEDVAEFDVLLARTSTPLAQGISFLRFANYRLRLAIVQRGARK